MYHKLQTVARLYIKFSRSRADISLFAEPKKETFLKYEYIILDEIYFFFKL